MFSFAAACHPRSDGPLSGEVLRALCSAERDAVSPHRRSTQGRGYAPAAWWSGRATVQGQLAVWHRATYDELLGRASDVHHTGLTDSDSQAHMAGSEILVGLVDELCAVWDGQPARGYGGTADVVAYARRTGVPVRVLWPAGARRG